MLVDVNMSIDADGVGLHLPTGGPNATGRG